MATQQQQVTNLTNQQTGLTSLNTQLTSIQAALTKVSNDAQALGSPSLFAYTQTINIDQPDAGRRDRDLEQRRGRRRLPGLGDAAGERLAADVPVHEPDLGGHGHDRRPADLARRRRERAGPGQRDQLQQQRQRLGDRDRRRRTTARPPWCCPTARPAHRPPPAASSRSATPPTRSPSRPSTRRPASTPSTRSTAARHSTRRPNTISGAPVTGTPELDHESRGDRDDPGRLAQPERRHRVDAGDRDRLETPAPSTQNITTAVQQFVTDYNAAVTQIQTQLAQTPSSSDPTQGTLFGDSDLQRCSRTCASRWTRPSAA